jgi:DNA polymerase III subunit gamma/tau
MGQALYRKYRSTNLSEVLGQEHITTALGQALKSGRISHAYLFTGPRGTGKTSIARILANEINKIPYSTDPHLDIIEIDAASNRRIDEIRDLRDKVYIAPASAKYKVYIIDEVHMLTREAFNALLKTLEEPPEHVIFMLATTDAHKLPETIVSRTQRYSLRPVELSTVRAHLADIAKKEKFDIDPEAIELLAEHGEGSFRDSISMLDQVSHHPGKVTADVVRSQLGVPPAAGVQAVLDSLQQEDITAPLTTLQALYDDGFRASGIAEQLSKQLRQAMVAGSSPLAPADTLTLLKNLLDVASSPNPERYLELTLLQSRTRSIVQNAPPVIDPPVVTAAPKPVAAAVAPAPVEHKPVSKPAAVDRPTPKADVEPAPAPAPAPAKKTNKKVTALDQEVWTQVLAELKKQYNTLYGIVRMAQTDFSQPGKVELGFAFPFHQKRINDPKNRKIVSDTIAEVSGQHVELVCVLRKAEAAPEQPQGDALKDVSNIFGGGELV